MRISKKIRKFWYKYCFILSMKKIITIIYIIFGTILSYGQIEIWPEDSLKEYEGNTVPIYTQDYMKKYNRMKRLVVKVYPYALYAADLIDEIDHNATKIEKRRKKNRFYKKSYQSLKENFKYFVLDLYRSEGRMLMKLIHRETGMTVYDISSKYRGKSKAEMFSIMAKIWDQDLNIKYNPNATDKITEHVITDIQSGRIAFNSEVVTVDKLAYKEQKKSDREQAKINKKNRKEQKKKNRQLKRQKKKAERRAAKK